MMERLQIELEPAKVLALDALARQSGKRRENLVAQAVEDLLALEKRNLDALQEGLDDLAAGRVTPHDRILPLIQSLHSRI